MPTGLTANIYDGEDDSFEGFVWRCARHMGALITMRDDSMDAPVPDHFEPHLSYHDKAIAEAKDELDGLALMKLAEAERRAGAEFARVRKMREEANRTAVERRSRYEAVLAQVQQWTPPTPDHVGLKELMVQQLEESIRFDCSMTGWPEYPKKSGAEWIAERREKAMRDLTYHSKERDEEIERTEARNRWVKALRKSVPDVRSLAHDTGKDDS